MDDESVPQTPRYKLHGVKVEQVRECPATDDIHYLVTASNRLGKEGFTAALYVLVEK